MTGRNHPEQVAGIHWNRWPTSPEYAGNRALRQQDEHRKYDYQINLTQALSKAKGVIGLLFHETASKVALLIADLQHIFQRTIEPIRPGRKYPRNHKPSQRKFFPAYKPIG